MHTVNTPSHLIITAALRRRARASKPQLHVPLSAVLWGSVAPDLPLTIMSIFGGLYYRFIVGRPLRESMEYIFNDLYFNNPWWIAAHNTLQAPFILATVLIILWSYRNQASHKLRHWFFWFMASCSLHSFIDILTHNDDGPLLLFPFNWRVRFESPVSYWDRDHYAGIFGIFENTLCVLLLVYLVWPHYQRWLARRREKASSAES